MTRKKIDSEKLVERTLVNEVRARGGLCIKLLSQHFIGLPDRICLFPGGVIAFVELKTTGAKPRKIQTFVHDKIRSLGFRVEVIDSVQGAVDLAMDLSNLPF